MADKGIYKSQFTGQEIDARLAEINSLKASLQSVIESLSDTYTKEQVDDIAAAIAASVDSTSGVVVTTLPTAAAGTLGKIYYVGPDASGFYDRYVTSYDGSSYSWLPLGNTEVDMTQYATKEDLAELEQIPIDPALYPFELGTLSGSNGTESASTTVARTKALARRDYVISCPDDMYISARWYDEKGAFISSSGTWTKKLTPADIPANCARIRICSKYVSGATIADVEKFNTYIKICYPTETFLAENVTLRKQMDALYVKRLAYDLNTGYVVDCRPESSNFGKQISQSNWGVSQWVDLTGIKYIRIYRNIASTAVTPSYSGLLFYDKLGNPMTEGIRRIIYGTGGTAFANWDTIQVPAGAAWFRVGVAVTAASTYEFPIELYAISPNEIAGMQGNDTYTMHYVGEKVDLNENAYRLRTVRSIAGGSQSAAIYGDYVFFLNSGMSTIVLFNMKTMVNLYTCQTGLPSDPILHCNQSAFGKERYDAEDMFPLLYTAAQNNAAGRCEWRAYRIVPTLSENEIASFTVSLVQTIYLPVMTDENCLGNANPAFDFDRDCLWSYSRNNNTEAANYRQARFTKFAIPAVFDTNDQVVSEITLSDADILDAFSADFSMAYAQGGFISRGKLFIGQGGPLYPLTVLRVIDLYAVRGQVTFFDLRADGMDDEPEGLYAYDGRIWMHTNSGRLYCFYM